MLMDLVFLLHVVPPLLLLLPLLRLVLLVLPPHLAMQVNAELLRYRSHPAGTTLLLLPLAGTTYML
jgi:hypothetical protein